MTKDLGPYNSIMVSAGHSDSDPGAVANGLREADLTLALRDQVAALLRRDPEVPRVVVDGPGNLGLPRAISYERTVDGPKVEFHFNQGPSEANGVEALSTPSNKRLAQALAQVTAKVLGAKLRGEAGWKDQAHAGPHSRLGFCVAGGVILEVAFISNKKEISTYQAKVPEVATAIAGVLKAFAKRGN